MKVLNLTDEEAAIVHRLTEKELQYLHQDDWDGDQEYKERVARIKAKLE